MDEEIIDPSIDVKVNLTLQKTQKKEVNAALSNTFGFGGQNASLLIKKYVPPRRRILIRPWTLLGA